MPKDGVQEIVAYVRDQAYSDLYAAYYRDLLCELIEIDTSIQTDVDRLGKNERAVFDVLERELKAVTRSTVKMERVPISNKITEHPYYSVPYYAGLDTSGEPLRCEAIYKDRCNLLALFDADDPAVQGTKVIYNAHTDTVGPWLGPRVEVPLIYGRGSVDDKGLAALLVAQIRLIEETKKRFDLKLGGSRVYQFVIEEEMGGNGSLSAAMDERFSGYEAVICEPTGNMPHPANRGALWYQCTLSAAGVAGAERERTVSGR